MTCRCRDLGLEEVFDAAFAEHDAKRYLSRGLPPRARRLLDLIKDQLPIQGVTALEGGAGAGALTIELARNGAARATGIDAVAPAVEQARRLAATAGATTAEFQLGDFADAVIGRMSAELVVLDRVVCCYPEWQPLLSNAATAARKVVALSYPPDRLLSRIVVAAINAFQRVMRRRFRMQLHSPARMHAYLAEHGFHLRGRRGYWFWELAVFSRS